MKMWRAGTSFSGGLQVAAGISSGNACCSWDFFCPTHSRGKQVARLTEGKKGERRREWKEQRKPGAAEPQKAWAGSPYTIGRPLPFSQ